MGQALPQIPVETPTVNPGVGGGATIPTPANDNFPPAANDNLPKANTPGTIRTLLSLAGRANLAYQGAKLVGRVLFDPNVFGDNNAYFADTPTSDATEAAMVKQGEIDIKQNGMDPQMVRSRVRKAIEEKRQKEKAEKEAKRKAEYEENVRVNGLCKVLAAAVYSKAAEVQGRFTDLMADKLNLINTARSAPSPSNPVGSGSWDGHVQQLQGQQKNLRDRIAAYDAAHCTNPPIPNAIRDMAHADIPSKPGGTPGYPFNTPLSK